MDISGVDVSHYQGAVDYAALAASGRSFVLIKATEGAGLVDPRHAANVAAARAAGLTVGHYHYLTGDDPAQQAAWFVRTAARRPGELLALDYEGAVASSAGGPAAALAWLQHVLALTGTRPLIYMNTDALAGGGWRAVVAAGYGLWLACPSDHAAASAPWPAAAIRQVGTGTVPGVTGPVDLDDFAGTPAELAAYGGPAAQSPTKGTTAMATSYNGCPASPDPAVIHVNKDFHAVYGSTTITFPGGVGQCQDLQDLFQYWEEQFFHRVEHPITGVYSHDGDWGYEYRADVNAPGQLSCHASASATDTNAIWHPDGSAHTFNAGQYATIGQILAVELGHTLRIGVPGLLGPDGKPVGWTADSTPDEMHVEAVSFDPQRWAAAAAKIQHLLGKGPAGPAVPGNPRSADGASITYPGLTVKQCQELLNGAGAAPRLAIDDVLGPLTAHAIREFQARHSLTVDGVVGPKTHAALVVAQPAKKRPAAPYPLKYPQVYGVWNYPGTDGRTGNPWRGETRSGDPRWDPQSIRNQVKLLQGAVGAAVDGVYGPHTETKVRAAQTRLHLAVDGLVGPATWGALFR